MLEDAVLQVGRRAPTTIDYVFYLAIGGYTAYALAREKIGAFLDLDRDRDEGDDDLDDLRERYVDGDLSHEEFEARVGIHLDDDARQARAAVEQIDGIGPELSAAIAQEFGTIDALEDADRDALEAVDGIGEQRAELIREKI